MSHRNTTTPKCKRFFLCDAKSLRRIKIVLFVLVFAVLFLMINEQTFMTYLNTSESPLFSTCKETTEFYDAPRNICDINSSRWARFTANNSPGYDFDPPRITLRSKPTCTSPPEDRYNWTVEHIYSLRKVYDIFKEDNVVIYSCTKITHRKDYPKPRMMKDDYNGSSLKGHCPVLEVQKWPMCCDMNDSEFKEFPIGYHQPCADMLFVAGIPCAYIDWGTNISVVPGTIYDDKRQFMLQTYMRPIANGVLNTVPLKFTRVASVLQVFGDQNGHFAVEVLPYIVYLLKTLPPDVPILIERNNFVDQFLQFLVSNQFVESMKRFIPLQQGKLYYANEVLVANLYPPCLIDANYWFTEELSGLMHRTFVGVDLPKEQRNSIVIIHRSDVAMRTVQNHDEMMMALNTTFPNEVFEVFVGKEYSGRFNESIELFKRAKIVIAPHGAGLFNIMFCARGTTVIEIGFLEGPHPLPSSFYALSIAFGHNYWLTMGNGTLMGKWLTAPVDEIVAIVQQVLHDQQMN